jgi:hypothetical protein
MNSDFSLIHESGKITAVRIWLFPDGTTNVNLTGTVSSTYLSNVKNVVAAANNNGLAVYLTFFSSWNQGDATTGNEAALWTYDINPVLSELIGHYNIFGVDVMNEFDGTGSNLAFVKYEIGKILGSYNVYTTASSNQSFSQAATERGEDGANFIDLHIYANPPITLPDNTSGYYAVIGEIGPSTVSQSNIESVDSEALSQASGDKWSAVFAWDFALDDSLELTNGGTNGFADVSWTTAGSDYAGE